MVLTDSHDIVVNPLGPASVMSQPMKVDWSQLNQIKRLNGLTGFAGGPLLRYTCRSVPELHLTIGHMLYEVFIPKEMW